MGVTRTMTHALVVVAVTGCLSDAREPEARELPRGTPLEMAADPVLMVGAVEGDPVREFFHVQMPFLREDERLVVPDLRANVIRVFGPNGEYLESLGGSGEGPGEFRFLVGAWAKGDTIEAFDFGLMRVTRFEPDGEVEVVRIDFPMLGHAPVPGVLDDQWIFNHVSNQDLGARSGLTRDEMVFVAFDRTGGETQVLAELPGLERYGSADGTAPSVTPFSPIAKSVIAEGRLYIAETSVPEIRVLASDGSLIQTIRWEPKQVEEPGRILSAVVHQLVSEAGPEEAPNVRRRIEAFPSPEGLPAFSDFLVDPEGFIWVRAYNGLDDAAALHGNFSKRPGGEWSILSAEGDHVAAVDVPEDVVLWDLTSSVAVGVRHDRLGVQYVEVYPIRRAQPVPAPTVQGPRRTPL